MVSPKYETLSNKGLLVVSEETACPKADVESKLAMRSTINDLLVSIESSGMIIIPKVFYPV